MPRTRARNVSSSPKKASRKSTRKSAGDEEVEQNGSEAIVDVPVEEKVLDNGFGEDEAITNEEPNDTAETKTDVEMKEKETIEVPVAEEPPAEEVGKKRKLSASETLEIQAPSLAKEDTPEAEEKPAKKKKKDSPELAKAWKPVKEDPTDFTGWTYLLQYVDQEGELESAREAYDAFLSHYPYCYGYWKKYADYERRKGNVDVCDKVFERGLKAIPLSVDLWVHYLTYFIGKVSMDEDAEQRVREQFERAIDTCGIEFRSSRLWEYYIKWEEELKNFKRVTSLYDRLLRIPTQAYNTHFENFQEFVNNRIPKEILPMDDLVELKKEMTKKTDVGEDSKKPPGVEESDLAAMESWSEEQLKALRDKIIEKRKKIHQANEIEVSKRWAYEDGIKRPYFHVKPLEKGQLKNWQEYLDWEVSQGIDNRIHILFERCLIACALYEDFWMRYVYYLETKGPEYESQLRGVFERACTIHLKKKPNIHMKWATFEESKGDFIKAGEILTQLETLVPDLLQVMYRRINLERRLGRLSEAEALYKQYLDRLRANSNSFMYTNMVIKYARFCYKILGDFQKGIDIVNEGIEKEKDSPRLYMQLVDIGMQRQPIDETLILLAFEKALSSDMEYDQKLMFSQRKIEFLEDFGINIKKLQEAFQTHHRLMKEAREASRKNEALKKSKGKNSGSSPSTTSAQQSYSQVSQAQYYPYRQGYGQYDYSNWNYNSQYSGYNYGTAGQWGSYSYY